MVPNRPTFLPPIHHRSLRWSFPPQNPTKPLPSGRFRRASKMNSNSGGTTRFPKFTTSPIRSVLRCSAENVDAKHRSPTSIQLKASIQKGRDESLMTHWASWHFGKKNKTATEEDTFFGLFLHAFFWIWGKHLCRSQAKI